MEDSQFETLKSSETSVVFPPHRRRHLKSETYRTLVRILSHCYDDSESSHYLQTVPEEPKQGEVTEHNEVGSHDHVESGKLLVQGPDHIELEKLLVQEEPAAEENSSQGKDLCHMQVEVDGLDHMNIMEGNEEVVQGDVINFVNSLGYKNQIGDGVGEMMNNQGSFLAVPEFCMDEFQPTRNLQIDKEHCIHEVSEAIDSFFGIDSITESSKSIEKNEERSPAVERNAPEEVENELRQKELELEKLIFTSGVTNSPLHVIEDDEIEEGEISGDFEINNESMDFLLEDAASLEVSRVENTQIAEGIIGKGELTGSDHRRVLWKDAELSSLIMASVDNVGNGMVVEVNENNRIEMPGSSIEGEKADKHRCKLEMVRNKNECSSGKEFDNAAACPENLLQCGNISEENSMTSTEKQDVGVLNRKKKRGPLTKEKRAKKKQKERIKRAEKNRKLGVKRLKLQPVLKLKTVTYCRHYLKGRCQVGEKCKFSHDTVPLTKSKPCCHFARHSCMKGDDCPFDHQLSKYPCNNILSKGFCGRGADCMFSHEVLVKEGSSTTSNASKLDLDSPSPLDNSSTKKQLNLNSFSHQNANSKSSSTGISPCKRTENNVAEPLLKSIAETTKTTGFLSHGKLPQCNIKKHIQFGSSSKAEDGVKVGHQMICSASDMVQNLNEITQKAPAVAPKGINFLSFGKTPLDGPSSTKPSSLPFNRVTRIGQSLLGESIKDKQVGSSAKRDDDVKVDNHARQSTSDMVQNLNEISNRTPQAMAPRGINSLSFGKPPVDDSIDKKLARLHSNQDDSILPAVQEVQSATCKLQNSNVMSVPRDQSLGRVADGNVKSTPSYFQLSLLSSTSCSSQPSVLSSTPSSVQKALRSTLAFAAKFESEIKVDCSLGGPVITTDSNKEARSSQNKSMNASTILDFLYSNSGKTRQ